MNVAVRRPLVGRGGKTTFQHRSPSRRIHPRKPISSEDDEDTGAGGASTSKFFWLWFGIPFVMIAVLAWMMGHC
jgi:hypothetical protein